MYTCVLSVSTNHEVVETREEVSSIEPSRSLSAAYRVRLREVSLGRGCRWQRVLCGARGDESQLCRLDLLPARCAAFAGWEIRRFPQGGRVGGEGMER